MNVYSMCVCVCSVAVMSDSVCPYGLWSSRILCPWDPPGKYTGVGCHFLFQGIFATQGSHLCLLHLLHWQADSLSLAPPGKPAIQGEFSKFNERERDLNPTISEISIDCDIDF